MKNKNILKDVCVKPWSFQMTFVIESLGAFHLVTQVDISVVLSLLLIWCQEKTEW